MSQSTPEARRDALRLASDEAEVRDALLDHSESHFDSWIFGQIDDAERRAAGM